MAKDKKAKAAEKKLRVVKKQDKKSTQKEKKVKARNYKNDDSDAEDVDLDALLAEYAKQQEQFLKVTEAISEPPSPRGSATIVASPSNTNEILLFGGEHFNGALASFFNDLFVYNVNRDEWRRVTSPNSPLPRSGHAWCRGGNAGGVYLFGGEFSSPKQGTFYHYNDFWHLDPSNREWSKIETKGKGPPARSGHRMTFFKNYIIVFGGFQDTSTTTKYLQDLWLYDVANFTWHCPALPPASQKPDARSSFSLLPHDFGAVLYGGYSRVKTTANVSSAKGSKGGSGATRNILKPVVHQDTWVLRVTPPGPDASPSTAPAVRWERRKRPTNAPNPPRAGTTMAYHKGRGISFGGVHDVEESEEGIESEFFNQLFVWNIDRNRFFQLPLRRPRVGAKKVTQAQETTKSRRARGRADEEELLANLKNLETRGALASENAEDIVPTSVDGESGKEGRAEKPTIWEMPHPRFNAQLAVQDDVLYIFGGTFEKGDREYTFDEMWAIDLGKLDGAKEIFRRELEDWQGSDSEEEDEEDLEGEGSSSEEEDGEQSDTASTAATTVSVAPSVQPEKPDVYETAEEASEQSALKDDLPHPRPFESLRDFFARTSEAWQNVLLGEAQYGMSRTEARAVKEIRKEAFERAETKWWDCREEIQALEDEQEEAGIGEVITLGKDAVGAGGPGRRR